MIQRCPPSTHQPGFYDKIPSTERLTQLLGEALREQPGDWQPLNYCCCRWYGWWWMMLIGTIMLCIILVMIFCLSIRTYIFTLHDDDDDAVDDGWWWMDYISFLLVAMMDDASTVGSCSTAKCGIAAQVQREQCSHGFGGWDLKIWENVAIVDIARLF